MRACVQALRINFEGSQQIVSQIESILSDGEFTEK
jgi:hypothetical protein